VRCFLHGSAKHGVRRRLVAGVLGTVVPIGLPFDLRLVRHRGLPSVGCAGFLSDTPIDAVALARGIRPDATQFSSPRLDASFLINCGRLLTGTIESAPSTYVKRVTGTDFQARKATVFYECETELCDLLVALTVVRAAEIAREWYGTSVPAKTKPAETNGRTLRRLAILKNLAALAKQGKADHKTLILRVEYRKQRQPLTKAAAQSKPSSPGSICNGPTKSPAPPQS
jgi:hypothetical protein